MKITNSSVCALLLTLLADIIISPAVGFAPPPSTITNAAPRRRKASIQYNTKKESNYNDDAFGFIFLGGSAAAQDPVFGATFLALSVAAVIATKLEVFPDNNKQVPAAVAGFTLMLVPVISGILPEQVFGMNIIPGESARLIELAFCSVSMLYGFVFSSQQKNT
jgi:hypothetical protein